MQHHPQSLQRPQIRGPGFPCVPYDRVYRLRIPRLIIMNIIIKKKKNVVVAVMRNPVVINNNNNNVGNPKNNNKTNPLKAKVLVALVLEEVVAIPTMDPTLSNLKRKQLQRQRQHM